MGTGICISSGMKGITFISVDDEMITIGTHRTSEHTFITKSPTLLVHVPGSLNAESHDSVTSVFNKNGDIWDPFDCVHKGLSQT